MEPSADNKKREEKREIKKKKKREWRRGGGRRGIGEKEGRRALPPSLNPRHFIKRISASGKLENS